MAKEVAEAVVWLFSNAPSFITGHVLRLDDGFLGRCYLNPQGDKWTLQNMIWRRHSR